MAENRYTRTIQMIGEDGVERLKAATVLIVGVGGVGSYAAEAIARSGVGRIILVDGDDVAVSNLNRQLVALTSTIGRNKAEVMAERIRDIDPECEVTAIAGFYGRGDEAESLRAICGKKDGELYCVDAIDDVDAKVRLIRQALAEDVVIVSAMGAAGKFETCFKTADLSKTTMCPLAKVMRKRLKAEGIEHLPVVYSEEKPIPRDGVLGTMSYVPGAAGLELAGYVIRRIVQ
ncbi:MAG: tRNA threonylcarbamoyladenosine dehydratase [Mogibacterium sp.]|nr:tRNA threonylcarbamoyladenosine dehydratase [Mogibacterium sp.]